MKVAEVMTRDVCVVNPDQTVKQVVSMTRVSGRPLGSGATGPMQHRFRVPAGPPEQPSGWSRSDSEQAAVPACRFMVAFAARPDRPASPAAFEILKPGRNCWRVERAQRAAVLTNVGYFRALAAALDQAKRQIILVDWDLDARIVLDPDGDGPERLPLHRFLDRLLARRPALAIRCLLWRRPSLYGGNRNALRWLTGQQRRQPRFAFHRRAAPLGACHHQKLVVIDGALAFVGGIDLTAERWDRSGHPAVEPARCSPTGAPYGPVRDVQMAVDGPAAAALAELACRQWCEATGERMTPPTSVPTPWPPVARPDFVDVPVAIARTRPPGDGPAVREVEALTRDALAAARVAIYIEAQYLTAEMVGDVIEERLRQWRGPQIVVVVTRHSNGLIEQLAMGTNRDRLVRRLRAADRHDRLRVYYPRIADGTGAAEMKIHSKLIIVDDRFLRVGSSNLNNRSMRVDTECDVAIEASDAAGRRQIQAIREHLIATLLARPRDEVAAALGAHDLISALERIDAARRLCPIPALPADGTTEMLPGTAVLDPVEPFNLRYLWQAVRRLRFVGASRIAARPR